MLCLIQFFDEWLDFRIPELKALLAMHDLTWEGILRADIANPDPNEDQHFYVVDLPSLDVVRHICSRAILVKAIYELWSSGPTLQDAIEATKALPSSFLDPYLKSEDSWAINLNTFGRTYTMEQKQDCRMHFKFLDFQGPVNVVSPSMELCICMDYHRYRHITPATVIADNEESLVRAVKTDVPTYFGRLLFKGGMKEVLRVHDLKKRLYLGPTSLDDSLALILANISGVKRGYLAYDPFVGTASILVALTQLGAVCTGSDIDPRVLRGEMHAGTTSADEAELPAPAPIAIATTEKGDKKKHVGVAEATAKKNSKAGKGTKRNIFENFKSYGLPLPDLVRMDNHLFDRHIIIKNSINNTTSTNTGIDTTVGEGYFDVIVTDPPYGIRAGAKKTGKNVPVTYNISEERRHDHIPSTQRYPVEEVMLDLLHTAATSLVLGGVLTYLLPTTYDFTEQDLPVHPCLELTQVCHQTLSARHGRRAIVMRKYREYTLERRAQYNDYKATVMSGQDEGFGKLMGKLEAALAVDAFTNDAVVKHLSVCSSKRKASKDRRREQREEGIVFPPKGGEAAFSAGNLGTLRPSKKALKKQRAQEQQQQELTEGQEGVAVEVPVEEKLNN